jgi:hypothetical protein
MARARSLEARYRRLLIWFPPEHRHEHCQEMAGVLLAAAEAGRVRPGRAESWNLMLGGLRVRLRPGRALVDGDGWRDALAIFSVVMPILVLAGTAAIELSNVAQLGNWNDEIAFVTVIRLSIYGQLLTVPLVLLGLRRCAVVATCGLVVMAGCVAAWAAARWLVVGHMSPTYGAFGSYVLVGGALELVALLASPGPRRGRQLLRGRRWAYVGAAVVPAVVVAAGPGALLRLEAWQNPSFVVPFLVVSATAVAALAMAWLTSGLGKRLAVLFAVLACAYLAPVGAQVVVTSNTLTLTSEVALAFVAVVVVRRARRRSRPAGD